MSRVLIFTFAAASLAVFLSSHCELQAQEGSTGPTLVYPLGAVRAEDGTTFIVDRKLPGVFKLAAGKLSVVTKGSKKFRTPLNAPRCIAFGKDGKLLVGDTPTREVYRIEADGSAKPLTGGGIGMAMAIAVDADGDIFVADLELHRIFKVPAEGGKPETFAAIAAPRGLAFDTDGNLLVVSTTEDQVFRVTPDGKASVVVPGRPFRFPHNIAVEKDGTIFVTDGYGKCVWKVAGEEKPVKLASGEPFANPVGITLTGETLLVGDSRANAVFEVDLEGKVSKLVSGPKK